MKFKAILREVLMEDKSAKQMCEELLIKIDDNLKSIKQLENDLEKYKVYREQAIKKIGNILQTMAEDYVGIREKDKKKDDYYDEIGY